MGFERHREDIAQLPIEIGQRTLRMRNHTDRDVGQARQALGQETQDHALAGARIAMDHRKAALANQRLFNAPAEVLDTRRNKDRLGRQFGREGIPFQPIQGQE